MQQDQKRGASPQLSPQLAYDIAQAEQALFLHIQSVAQPAARHELSKQAETLIFHLQQHALQQRCGVSQAESVLPQADTQDSHLTLEAALHTSRTALLDTIDKNLLSELCSVLHSLYVRRADLHMNHALPTEAAAVKALPQHNANHLLLQTDAHAASGKTYDSHNNGFMGAAPKWPPGSLKSPQRQGEGLDNGGTADAACKPDDRHQQIASDCLPLAALRYS